ncbi:MAG: PH domain-containing protein [Methanocellales archaeon]|nr:PH domain-containing protein [Methanocellales archaeon]MDD3291993.1 PH domain-containing protein [Methanocellales archaeon]MDD5235889.1 PH domain-containing protein [Methanocellales archaeon]MDD5485452.1 PH domain-containing protein [Methanocellales archaeon]
MQAVLNTKVGEEFRPAQQFKSLYYIYLMLGTLFGILPWCIPVVYFAGRTAPFLVTFFVLVPLLALLIFVAYWIPKYYDTMLYKLTENEMVWRRGVWFKNTGIVPYNRITNIDIAQGPISRMLRIASLKIQTAGYSAPSGGTAEIKIEGVEQFEELRELIMGFVRGKKPVAVETYEEEDINSKILDELVKIRKSLEKSSEK